MPKLLCGMHTSEDRDAVEVCAQILLGHLLQFATVHGHVAIARDAQRAGDGEAGDLVIARDHDRADASVAAFGHGGFHFIARWVHLADETEETKATSEWLKPVRFIDHCVIRLGHREHAQGQRGEIGGGLMGLREIKRRWIAEAQDHLWRTFDDDSSRVA